METYKCIYCGENVKRRNSHHLKKCLTKYVNELTEDTINEWYDLYINQEYSLVDMAKHTNLPYQHLQKILPMVGIELRDIKNASNTKKIRQKREETCIEHFGCRHNFCKDSKSRQDWERKLLEEEGITNVFQRESVKKKIHNTMLQKYGEEGIFENRRKGNFLQYYIDKYGEEEGRKYFEWVSKRKSETSKIEYYIEKYGEEEGISLYQKKLKKTAQGFKHNNGLNDKCRKILESKNINYVSEFPITDENGKTYLFDFKIDNLLLELNGTYWHCSPKIYQENDMVKMPGGKFIKAKDKWESDKRKSQVGIQNGYDFSVIWEDEFNEETLLKTIYGNSKN